MRPTPQPSRTGIAVVEFAVLLPLLLLLLCGLWVVGNLIAVHQVLDWAAREGARLAAQGQIVNLEGAYTAVTVDTSSPSVKSLIEEYLEANGVSSADLKVEFTNLDSGLAQPWQAKKGDRLSVIVKLPHDNVRLPVITRLPGWILPDPDFLIASVNLYSVQDDPFELDANLPEWDAFE